MVADERTQLVREYQHYDRRCDVVSCFEVFFTAGRGLSETVSHFERFPSFIGSDGDPVTPDFTVLFVDGTLLVGEVSNLARNDESLDSLLRQIGRYSNLTAGPSAPDPGGGHHVDDVIAADVLVLVPAGEANAARDRITAAAESDTHPYAPTERASVLGYMYDDANSRFVFTHDGRADTPRPPDHGRDPGLAGWLEGNHDTLSCRSERFSQITAVKRFMNDRPPAIYTATLLWLDALPALGAPQVPPVDIEVTPAQLAAWLRENYGWGDAAACRSALEFLERAGLARRRADDWLVGLKSIASGKEEIRHELVSRYLSKPKGPATATDRNTEARRRQSALEEAEDNLERQQQLEPEHPSDGGE